MACAPLGLAIRQTRSLVSGGSLWRRELRSRTVACARSQTIIARCLLSSSRRKPGSIWPQHEVRRWIPAFAGMTETRAAALLPLPGVNRCGARFPDRRALGAGQCRDGAVFGRHRHPILGLAHHRRLAGDRVAQDGEAVARADGEGVETVEIPERGLERLLERGAFAHPPAQITRRHLAVVVGGEMDAAAAQALSQPVMVRQRAVMDE